MKDFASGWYVIYTRPKHEKKIVERLAEQEVACYLPLMRKVSQWHDRKKVIEVPLFPNYVFIQLDSLHAFYKGAAVDGFVNYIKFENKIARVSNDVIESIKIAMGGENVEVSDMRIAPGQQLMVTEGPLAGCNCEVVEYKGKTKVLVRISLLKRNILVDIPLSRISSGITTPSVIYGA